MLRVYVDLPLRAACAVDLPPGPSRHVQVRRLQPGDALVLFDGRGGEWRARVHAIGRQSVRVEPLAHDPVERELAPAVTLVVGMPANERMDWLVEKATELGAAALQPVLCERSVLRLEGERAERRRIHWQALAVAAAEQCGRTRVPAVHPVRGLGQVLAALPAAPQRWLLSPGAQVAPQRPEPSQPLLVLSGPEGGLSAIEAQAAQAAGFEPRALGPRVLRAETAPLALLAWLSLA
ncbi:MAG TPA: 16S rRNA (uracil(1498)-N(3))-methyltransferase [Rubrivivax sp.]|nr:16S rRNA (uracil(1498)-N(3))-methyltransferase [Burkholderiales bacterium]HNT37981.1 16S rRNA (uracil(1498)-N(3))-methyltransferase [Rubrivivax sp.]